MSAGVFIYSRGYLDEQNIESGEFCVLGLCGVLGMMIMASANTMLLLYLGLELQALCIYALVALKRDSVEASEAAMKYFVLGALASGILLYGMSIIYGLTGSLELGEISNQLASHSADDIVLIFAVVFVVTAMCFKLGAVPFHMWLPDVYQGSPTPSTLFLSAAPKLAGFALIIRLLVGGLEDLHGAWRDMLVVIALLSVVFGNVIAIAQTNIKRMLAYSTISHMGFFLLGILSGTQAGYSAAMFYIIVYAFMTLAAFGVVIAISRPTDSAVEDATVDNDANLGDGNRFDEGSIDHFRGLFQQSPWLAVVMLLIMFSMAGIPPTAGFLAKMGVISAAIDAGLIWLAVIAVIFAVIGAFYYLRIVWYMFFESPMTDEDLATESSLSRCGVEMRWILAANAALVVVILPWIGSLTRLADTAVATMLR